MNELIIDDFFAEIKKVARSAGWAEGNSQSDDQESDPDGANDQ